MQRHIEIDGFPLIVKESARGRTLCGDLSEDDESKQLFNLSGAIGLVSPGMFRGDQTWEKIRSGQGVYNQGLSMAQVRNQDDPAVREAFAAFAEKTGKPPEGPMWMVSSPIDYTSFYIPYGTLMKILTLSRAIELGEEVVLPEGAVERAVPGASLGDAGAPAPDEAIFPDLLDDLDRRVGELLAAVAGLEPGDVEARAAVGAKRRFLHAELDELGAFRRPVLVGLQPRKHPHLARYLAAIGRFQAYLTSDERARFNQVDGDVSCRDAPVSVEWFLHNRPPEGTDEFDWLGRCEAIYAEQGARDEALFYTRIHGHRVKLVSRYEDGVHLKLVSAVVM